MFLSFITACLLIGNIAPANNLKISVPALIGKNTAEKYVYIKFDVSWDNSWRLTSEPSNWDAAWIFIKYRSNSGIWKHATLHATGHQIPVNASSVNSGDNKGVFLYRSGTGNGSVMFSNIKLRWDYGTDLVDDTSRVLIKVMGIEMVYVNEGSFFVGSGGQEPGTFTDGSWDSGNTYPFQITSENAIPVGQTAGKLWAMYSREGDSIGDSTSIPATFPKGYKKFYCMKYPITQDQYVDFLNTLTYTQQEARTAVAPSSPSRTKAMVDDAMPSDRNGIQIQTSGIPETLPAVYGCDLDSNGVFNQSNDGQNIPCNWLSWADGAAYCDWAALRPMTELEYEKACRGPLSPVQYECPYGSNVLAHLQNINNAGMPNESYVSATEPLEHFWNDTLNGASNLSTGGYAGFFDYPIRVGIFATGTSNRVKAGATYYGIMDMGGNVWSRTVTVGNNQGRNFLGTHGDGTLGADGNASGNNDWPDPSAAGAGFRGGNFDYDSDWAYTSDRDLAVYATPLRYDVHTRTYNGNSLQGYRGTFGFRGVRTAP